MRGRPELNIFGDHSDVMACRQTGFAMLCSNPQEVWIWAPSHSGGPLRDGFLPAFFDGSDLHDVDKIECWTMRLKKC
jgi:pyruvate-ferredoxin/flavodoxin oxidoreductase